MGKVKLRMGQLQEIRTEKSRANSRDIAMQVAIFLLYVCTFSVVLTSGLSADDMWNSNIQAAPYLGGPGAIAVMLGQWKMWLEAGRVFPFSNYVALLFTLIPSVPVYKACLVFMTWFSNWVSGLCIEKMTGSKCLRILYMVLFPVLVQMTPEFDSGLYCYHMLIQLVVLWCFLSLWLQIRYLDTGKKRYAVESTAALFLALGTYEVAFPFILILAWVTYRRCRSGRKTIRKMLPELIVFLGMLAGNGVLRVLAGHRSYHGVSIHLQWKTVLITWLKQCSTCVPLGRYLCSILKECRPYSDVYPYTIREIFSWLQIWDYLAIGLLIGIWFQMEQAWKKEQAVQKQTLWTVFVVGCLTFILPGGLIAVSAKYQQTIAWAGGHLPAYMQSVGFTMMLVCVYRWLSSRLTGWKRKLFGIVCLIAAGLILTINMASARAGVEYMNQTKRYPQENIEAAAANGFFDTIAEDDRKYVFGANGYIHDAHNSAEFYSKLAGMHIYACTDAEVLADSGGKWNEQNQFDLTKNGERVYYGIFNWADRDGGLLLMGPCEKIQSGKERKGMKWIQLRNPQVYVSGDRNITVPQDWQLLQEGEEYAIYQLHGSYRVKKEMKDWTEWIAVPERCRN